MLKYILILQNWNMVNGHSQTIEELVPSPMTAIHVRCLLLLESKSNILMTRYGTDMEVVPCSTDSIVKVERCLGRLWLLLMILHPGVNIICLKWFSLNVIVFHTTGSQLRVKFLSESCSICEQHSPPCCLAVPYRTMLFPPTGLNPALAAWARALLTI